MVREAPQADRYSTARRDHSAHIKLPGFDVWGGAVSRRQSLRCLAFDALHIRSIISLSAPKMLKKADKRHILADSIVGNESIMPALPAVA